MLKRALWLGIGVAVGALAVRALTNKAKAFTPSGLAGSARHSASGVIGSVRSFIDDVRDGMAEREAQIHAAFDESEDLLDDDYEDEYDRYKDDLVPPRLSGGMDGFHPREGGYR